MLRSDGLNYLPHILMSNFQIFSHKKNFFTPGYDDNYGFFKLFPIHSLSAGALVYVKLREKRKQGKLFFRNQLCDGTAVVLFLHYVQIREVNRTATHETCFVK